jgi:hypothetical protein
MALVAIYFSSISVVRVWFRPSSSMHGKKRRDRYLTTIMGAKKSMPDILIFKEEIRHGVNFQEEGSPGFRQLSLS